MSTELAITVGGLAVGGLVWLIRLEGRVNLAERLTNNLIEDVRYIRNRIDAALNGRHDD